METSLLQPFLACCNFLTAFSRPFCPLSLNSELDQNTPPPMTPKLLLAQLDTLDKLLSTSLNKDSYKLSYFNMVANSLDSWRTSEISQVPFDSINSKTFTGLSSEQKFQEETPFVYMCVITFFSAFLSISSSPPSKDHYHNKILTVQKCRAGSYLQWPFRFLLQPFILFRTCNSISGPAAYVASV